MTKNMDYIFQEIMILQQLNNHFKTIRIRPVYSNMLVFMPLYYPKVNQISIIGCENNYTTLVLN